MWIAMLRSPRDDQQQKVQGLGCGCVELWGDPVRHGLRLLAFLGWQHFSAVQEDPLWGVCSACRCQPSLQGPSLPHPMRRCI